MSFKIPQNITRKVFEKTITDIDNHLRNKRRKKERRKEGNLKTLVKEINAFCKDLLSHMAYGMINKP